jgi:hypothetical protein
MITSALIHPQHITEKALENQNNKNDNFIFVIIVVSGDHFCDHCHGWFTVRVIIFASCFERAGSFEPLKRITNAHNPSKTRSHVIKTTQ